MTGKNLYDLLGVPRNATPEQIRQAYVLRSKMLHPDRFNQTTQRAEWELANEMLKELNHAYGVLRDSSSRAQYDRTIPGTTTHQTPPHQQQPPPRGESPPPPKPTVKLGRLKSGTGNFDSLPRSAKQRLTERVTGTNKVQFAIKLSEVGWNYFGALLLVGWFVILFYQASAPRWNGDTFGWLIGLTGVVALLQALNIDWMVRWHKSPLRCWLLITPLYVIKTHLDRVWYWPIWEISDIRATHNYKNGIYQGTSLHMAFGSTSEDLTISPETAYDSMLSALRAFDQKFRSANSQQDWMYFYEQDDFREFDPETTAARPRRALARTAAIFTACFVIYGISFAIAESVNGNQARRSTYTYNPPQTYVPPRTTTYRPQPTPPPFLEPELPLPPNGETYNYTRREAVAPFEIKSSYGSSYLVKLADASTGQPVLTVFVRGGNTVNLDVPLGTYVVKYAAGDKWYGYNFLFGPATGYSKANETFTFRYNGNQVSGYTITLYKVRNGNLRTGTISANEF
jgi:curved DNA-binding protein CbpA